MLKKAIHIILAILFLPICFSVGFILYEEIGSINRLSSAQLYFFYGCIFYLIFHILVFKPERIYIFGHEMMHAIATILSGGKVSSFNVSKAGGSIRTNKSNVFISLAPYLFPFYTILTGIVYFILAHFKKDVLIFSKPFLFVVGFTLTFHIVLTVDFLKIKQTDLLGTGYIFSIELICFVNLLIIAFIFSLLFKEIEFGRFFSSAFVQSKQCYVDIFRHLFL